MATTWINTIMKVSMLLEDASDLTKTIVTYITKDLRTQFISDQANWYLDRARRLLEDAKKHFPNAVTDDDGLITFHLKIYSAFDRKISKLFQYKELAASHSMREPKYLDAKSGKLAIKWAEQDFEDLKYSMTARLNKKLEGIENVRLQEVRSVNIRDGKINAVVVFKGPKKSSFIIDAITTFNVHPRTGTMFFKYPFRFRNLTDVNGNPVKGKQSEATIKEYFGTL